MSEFLNQFMMSIRKKKLRKRAEIGKSTPNGLRLPLQNWNCQRQKYYNLYCKVTFRYFVGIAFITSRMKMKIQMKPIWNRIDGL